MYFIFNRVVAVLQTVVAAQVCDVNFGVVVSVAI